MGRTIDAIAGIKAVEQIVRVVIRVFTTIHLQLKMEKSQLHLRVSLMKQEKLLLSLNLHFDYVSFEYSM